MDYEMRLSENNKCCPECGEPAVENMQVNGEPMFGCGSTANWQSPGCEAIITLTGALSSTMHDQAALATELCAAEDRLEDLEKAAQYLAGCHKGELPASVKAVIQKNLIAL